MKTILHLSSAHPRYDIRIYHKMCKSSVHADFKVHLIVADGQGDDSINGINIHDIGAPATRMDRIISSPSRIFTKALTLNPDLCHLHDPELLPIGLKLRKLGYKVIFDSHENVSKQMLGKPYLNIFVLKILSFAYHIYESFACRSLSGIIAATSSINHSLSKYNSNIVTVNNYPMLNELSSGKPWQDRQPHVAYVGAIAAIRGVRQLVEAMSLVRSSCRLSLVGCFDETNLESSLSSHVGWQRIDSYGFLDRPAVQRVLSNSIAGIVCFHPLPNHIDALPNKLFEYMSAGLPVIASDFPLWRAILTDYNCGILVDPYDPHSIAAAIDYLVDNPLAAQTMGENGRRAVETTFNWHSEESKLVNFYNHILSS